MQTSEQHLQHIIYNLCGFEAQCNAATDAFDAVSSCDTALQNYNIAALCTGTCRRSLEGILNSCSSVSGSKL